MENFTANITQPSGENPTIQSIVTGKLDSHTWQLTEWRSDDSEFPGDLTFRPRGESGLLHEGELFNIAITPTVMTSNVECRMRDAGGTEADWSTLYKDTDGGLFTFTNPYPTGTYNRAVEFQLYDPTTATVYDTKTCRFINQVNE